MVGGRQVPRVRAGLAHAAGRGVHCHTLLQPLLCVSQCCDLGFHASLARTFRTYLSAEYNLETSRHEGLDIIENAVDNLDARSDKHTIMDMCNQVFCPPLKFEFQPHMGDEVMAHCGAARGLPCPAPPLNITVKSFLTPYPSLLPPHTALHVSFPNETLGSLGLLLSGCLLLRVSPN